MQIIEREALKHAQTHRNLAEGCAYSLSIIPSSTVHASMASLSRGSRPSRPSMSMKSCFRVEGGGSQSACREIWGCGKDGRRLDGISHEVANLGSKQRLGVVWGCHAEVRKILPVATTSPTPPLSHLPSPIHAAPESHCSAINSSALPLGGYMAWGVSR